MENNESIKYFTSSELNLFFHTLEEDTKNAKTEYSKKCAIRNEALFKILYYCSLRASEVAMLRKENYNDLKHEIFCKRIKGGMNNTLVIVEENILFSLKKHLSYNKPKVYLFENFKTNDKLSRKTLYFIFRKVCRSKNIGSEDKWHPHTLRHTRAVILAEAGFDLKELQYWLGHKHISNTLIYYQFTSKQHEAMYKKLKKGRKKHE